LLSRLVPGRAELAALATYLADAATRAGAEIRCGIDASADLIVAERPTAVIVATGARPGMPDIPGIAESPAADLFDVLRRPGGGVHRALVIGGGLLGVAVAHVLAERGVDVTLTEPGIDLAGELGVRPRWRFVEDLRARRNVTVLTRTTVEELSGDGALLRCSNEDSKLDGLDLVVPSRPMVPARSVATVLGDLPGGPLVYEVGDCVVPRTAFEAMQDAATLAHRL
jgi:NADPH-dependent 2,4-dienoyl-CoA reductase/sulfur reductase-like enzyme